MSMNWLNLRRVSAPLDTVVSLAEAKRHLNVFHNDDDALINALIEQATSHIEGPNGIGRCLLTQTWRQSHDRLEAISLNLGPVISIDAIEVLGEVMEPDQYVVDLDLSVPVIVRAPNTNWPSFTPQPGAVKVTFKAGYGSDPETVPAVLRRVILLLVGHYSAHRGDEDQPIPAEIDRILSNYRAAQ
jgi:uncharacterized phiE125 gp8 family phage protein